MTWTLNIFAKCMSQKNKNRHTYYDQSKQINKTTLHNLDTENPCRCPGRHCPQSSGSHLETARGCRTRGHVYGGRFHTRSYTCPIHSTHSSRRVLIKCTYVSFHLLIHSENKRDVQRKNVVKVWTSQVYGHHDKIARTNAHRTSQNTEYTKTQQTYLYDDQENVEIYIIIY